MDSQKKTEDLVTQGILSARKGKHLRAVEFFSEALELSPGNPVVCFNLALEYLCLHEPETALVYLCIALEADPENPDYWCEKGIAQYEAGDYPGAEECYDRALSCGGDSSRLRNSLGVLRFVNGAFEEAKEFFTRAAELDPANRDAWFNLADTLEELGDRQGARHAKGEYEKLSSRRRS